MPGANTGPATYGSGTWPNKDFSSVDDLGLRRACELAQNLARRVRSRVATEDEVRTHAGYSQRRLARDAGIKSQVTVKQVLEGQHFVRLDILMKLLDTLNAPLSAVNPGRSVRKRTRKVTLTS